MIAAVLVVTCLLVTGAGLLLLARRQLPRDDEPLVEAVNRLLPQSQCGKCGFPGCRPYAQAITRGHPINLCPPGGATLIDSLASLLGRDAIPLDASLTPEVPGVALIDEHRCTGCALCLPACPVDAIVGAPRFVHTVIADACTGCELCLPPCPVDCIAIEPLADQAGTPVDYSAAQPCVRCGDCIDACPVDLRPDVLHRLALQGNRAGLEAASFGDCILCTACTTACPSHLPLADQFRAARVELERERRASDRARAARSRNDAREARMARQEADKARQRAGRSQRIAAHQGAAWSDRG